MLLSMVIVARVLGREGYGELGMIRTTINMFATLGGVGLGLTANTFVARFRDTDKKRSGQIVGSSIALAVAFGFVVAVVVFAASGTLARDVLAAPQLTVGLKLAAVLLLFAAVNGAQLGVLQGLEAYRRIAVASSVQGLVGLVAFVLGAYRFGLDGVLVGFLVHSVAGLVLFQLQMRAELSRQGIVPTLADFRAVLPIFWSFSIPAALMGIAVSPFKWASETALSRNSGFDDLGVFHASMTFATIFVALVSILNSPLISLVANTADSSRSSRVQYLNLYGSWYVFLVLALPFIALPALPAALFGADYSGADFRAVVLLLLLYSGFLMYYQGVMRFVTLRGSMWFGLVTNLCEGLTLIVVFYLARSYGAVGLAFAYICSYVMRTAVTTPFLISKGIVPRALLTDKYFIATFASVCAIVAFQILREPVF